LRRAQEVILLNCTLEPPEPINRERYYIDLNRFAQLAYQCVLDKELQNAANEVTTALAIGNAIIINRQYNSTDVL
jgi:hypothetical protein